MPLELGIATPAVPREPAALDAAFCSWARGLGVSVIGTHLGPTPEDVPTPVAREIRQRLADHGIRVVQATGYNPNMVQFDDDRRAADLDRLSRAFEIAHNLGSPIVLSGCGTYRDDWFYGAHPLNHGDRARQRLIEFLRLAGVRAEVAGVALVLECHALTTLDTARTIRDLLDAVDSMWVRANFDPVNLLSTIDAVFDSGAEMLRMVETVGGRYHPMMHAKDVVVRDQFVVSIGEAPCGEGILDWPAALLAASTLGDCVPVLVEHFGPEHTAASLAFLREKAAEAGVTLA
jgi:sugar phosphate isomerase/epimerase